MCIYPSTAHRVCVDCRVSYKRPTRRYGPDLCLRCHAELIYAGAHLAVPRKSDKAGWRVLETVLRSGLTFRGGCCGTGPGYRPRTNREVRERMNLAERTGIPLDQALALRDPELAATPGTGVPRAASRREPLR
ncbi:hypothetical protein [Nocardia crassostreae]|uniref:hypothetical protein n=1 Tax=Nocardia crassostreae TaxID=53428 RepID=UPI000A0117FE|nr:hypothetical protein [Nocardia crassostreae]